MSNAKKFGTSAVYFTALSTIVGAIVFLRFGFAVGSVGLWGAFILITIGHLVTIPTALAISELATNKRVEGGGEYFIISLIWAQYWCNFRNVAVSFANN